MTNEEKALYLSQKYGAPKNKNREIAIYQSTIEMAEWKDKQFNEFKNKVKNFLNECDMFHMYKNVGWPDELENELFQFMQ